MTDAERLLSDPAALDAWLEERQGLCDAATKGPWTLKWITLAVFWFRRGSRTVGQDYYDVEFVSDARTSLPTAMEVIRRLRERVVELQVGREHFSRSGLRGTQCCDVVIDGMIGGAIDELKRLREQLVSANSVNLMLKGQYSGMRSELCTANETIAQLEERVAGCPWCSEGERPTLDKVLADLAELPKLRELVAQNRKWRESRICALEMAEEESRVLRERVAALEAERPTLPKIICLCGSTRFVDTWINEYQRLSDAGNIVLTVARMPPRPTLQFDEPELKVRLDELHKRKIDLCDEVFVLNVGGYIGDSTRGEVSYAMEHGKPVMWLESRDAAGEWSKVKG